MRSLVRGAVLLVFLVVAGCPDKRPPSPSGGTIACVSDADCHSPACGPCTSGEPLVQLGPSCAVNPCPNKPVMCSPQKICVVR
jgi:hypothetical protein